LIGTNKKTQIDTLGPVIPNMPNTNKPTHTKTPDNWGFYDSGKLSDLPKFDAHMMHGFIPLRIIPEFKGIMKDILIARIEEMMNFFD
jgi:hypothetical protein